MSCPSLFSAISFAEDAHRGRTRLTGEPFADHPVTALRILMEASIDLPLEAYVAGVLHDVLEESDVSTDEFRRYAGDVVADAVIALTKDATYYRTASVDRERLYLSALARHSAKTPWIALVKAADRIHNVATISALPASRQRLLCAQTRELYLPFFASLICEGACKEAREILLKRLVEVLIIAERRLEEKRTTQHVTLSSTKGDMRNTQCMVRRAHHDIALSLGQRKWRVRTTPSCTSLC